MSNPAQRITTRLIQALVLSCISFSGLSDEAGLYDLAPPGSAFLRIINLQKNSPKGMLTLRIERKSLSADGYCSASRFIYLPPGDYGKQINGLAWKGSLGPDQAYSLLIADKSVTLVKDYRADDSRRGMLAVYNFSSRPRLSLHAGKLARPVLANIPQGASAARGINPLKSAFSVVDSDEATAKYKRHKEYKRDKEYRERNEGNEAKSLATTQPMIFQPGVLSTLFICSGEEGLFTRWADKVGGH